MNKKTEFYQYFKSIVDEDRCAVVICNLEHRIIYMNPIACERYAKRGGAALIGKSLLNCHNAESNGKIVKVIDWFKSDKSHSRIFAYYNEKENKDVYMVALRDEQGDLIGYYEKHEYRNRETAPVYQFE